MILWSICFLFRVDPNVKVSHGGRPQDSAVEYAVDNERNEALAIMQEFKIDIPNEVKFISHFEQQMKWKSPQNICSPCETISHSSTFGP